MYFIFMLELYTEDLRVLYLYKLALIAGLPICISR